MLDDVLDYEGANVGKPSDGADLKLGLVTAPVLLAWDEVPEMGTFIQRRFSEKEDVQKVDFQVDRLYQDLKSLFQLHRPCDLSRTVGHCQEPRL